MTNMPLTHCHTCGRELPWNRIYLGDRAYCGAECVPAKTVGASTGPQTCHACGKELGELPRWHLQDQTFCSPECMFPGIGTMTWEKQRSARIAALEADLAAKDARIAALEKERAEIVTYYEGMGDERDLDEARLEADLAEALDVLSAAIQGAWGARGVLRCQTETSRLAAQILAKHRRFRITRWGDDWTEGEWVEQPEKL